MRKAFCIPYLRIGHQFVSHRQSTLRVTRKIICIKDITMDRWKEQYGGFILICTYRI
jgi:hypothetical protein